MKPLSKRQRRGNPDRDFGAEDICENTFFEGEVLATNRQYVGISVLFTLFSILNYALKRISR